MTRIIYNKDVNVPTQMSTQFPHLTKLLNNTEINKEFEGPEQAANRFKFLFNATGTLSLIFIVLVLLNTAWRLFLHTVDAHHPTLLLWIGACLGSLWVVLALSSHLLGFQEKWLNNRFITERLRQWKFQQLLDGALIALSQTAPAQFEKEIESRWAKVKFDVLDEAGTMNDFLNAEDFELFVSPSVCPDIALAEQLRDAYLILRLEYQARYFSFKKSSLGSVDSWTSAIAKSSLLLAGLLALGEVISLLVLGTEQESTLSWILAASALSAALLAAAVRVFRSARAISEETERYASKWVRLKTLAERFQREAEPTKRLEAMVETERVCVEELREFIRTFKKSDYLM